MREAMAGGRGGRGGRADVSAPQSSPRGSGRCQGEEKGEDGEVGQERERWRQRRWIIGSECIDVKHECRIFPHKYMCICFVCAFFSCITDYQL